MEEGFIVAIVGCVFCSYIYFSMDSKDKKAGLNNLDIPLGRFKIKVGMGLMALVLFFCILCKVYFLVVS